MGIEPTLAAWEAAVLPLNYTRASRAVYAPVMRIGNAGAGAAARPAQHQKPPPMVANTVAWLPPFCPAVTLLPRLASSPKTCVRTPNVSVP